MFIAFLDEFGHIGPFVARSHLTHKTSPVFGIGGILLPNESVRGFATWFFQLKARLFARELKARHKHPATWEKKGANFFSIKNIRKYDTIRGTGLRMLSRIKADGGQIFYYGREKWQAPCDSNSLGLHKTILSHSISKIDKFCDEIDCNYLMILDQHSSRKGLLETAAKTMFGENPARRLLEPPFEVESHLYQTVQAADWVATLIGRCWAFRLESEQFADHEIVDQIFGARIDQISTHSSVLRRPRRQTRLRLSGDC